MLVQALASEVANYRKAPGDFAQWRADHPQFDPDLTAACPIPHAHSRICLEGLSAKVREVLAWSGRLSHAGELRQPGSIAGRGGTRLAIRLKDLDRALTELEDRGLIGWDREANRYDAHPIVRGVVWQLTDAKDRRASMPSSKPISSRWQCLMPTKLKRSPISPRRSSATTPWWAWGGMTMLTTCSTHRLERATLFRLAAYRERNAWLERLVPDGVDGLPVLTDERDQAHALNALAQGYLFSGQPHPGSEIVSARCRYLGETRREVVTANHAFQFKRSAS